MSKKNNKGFLLAESLIVSTFVLTVITLIFIQFKNLMANNKRHYTYNSVENIYNLGSLSEYLKNNEKQPNALNNALSSSTSHYFKIYDGSSCASSVLVSGTASGCSSLASDMNLKYVLYTDSNVELVKESITNIDQDMRDFIEKVEATKIVGKGRLFAKFNDGSFATIAMDQKETIQSVDRIVYYSLGSGNNMSWWNKIRGDTITQTYNSATRMNHLTINTKTGWEQLYIPLKTDPDTSYKLQFDYDMETFSYYDSSHQGVACQLLEESESDSDVSDSDHISEGSILRKTFLLKSGVKGTATVEFTTSLDGDMTFLVFNFGYALDNRTVKGSIGNIFLVKDLGNSTTYGHIAIPSMNTHPFKAWRDKLDGTGPEINELSAVSPSLFRKNASTGIYEEFVSAVY